MSKTTRRQRSRAAASVFRASNNKTSSKTSSSISPPLQMTDVADVAKSPTPESFFSALHGMFMQVGRETQPGNFNPFAQGGNGSVMHGYFWLPKRQPQTIDIEDMDAYAWSPGSLLNILADISPDISKSLWNRLRITGTEVTFKAMTPTGDEDPKGQSLIDESISRINPNYGGIDNIISQMVLSMFCWGAAATDHAILPELMGTDDMFVVNPDSIYFERDENQYPIPYQLQYMWMNRPEFAESQALYDPSGSGATGTMLPFRRLNLARFTYTPFDPGIDDPYGRSPAWPALQVVFFMAQMLRDLQRVMENQAWPHMDFSLDWEILKDMMNRVSPEELNSPQKLAKFIRDRISEVQQQYNSLEPRMALVHPSYLTVTQNVKGASLEGIDDIVVQIRREIAKALKEVPLFMDMDESVNGDVAAAQFEIYIHGINRFRTIAENHIKRHLALNCWLNGHDCRIVADWQPIRSTQRLSDAQAERLEVGNEQMKRDNGWTDNDQAAKRITGTKAVREPDWEHMQNSKSNGQMGEVAAGEDKNTSQKSALKSKNAREFASGDLGPSVILNPENISSSCSCDCSLCHVGEHCNMTENCRSVSYDSIMQHIEDDIAMQQNELTKLRQLATANNAERLQILEKSMTLLANRQIPTPVVHVDAPRAPIIHVEAPIVRPVIEFKPNIIAPEARVIDNTKFQSAPKPKRVRKEVIRDSNGIIVETVENNEY